mgnify:CR=1 FL=1
MVFDSTLAILRPFVKSLGQALTLTKRKTKTKTLILRLRSGLALVFCYFKLFSIQFFFISFRKITRTDTSTALSAGSLLFTAYLLTYNYNKFSIHLRFASALELTVHFSLLTSHFLPFTS